MTDKLLDRIDKPQDLHGLVRGRAAAGRAGGARAADRHGRRDRRALRRQPRRLRDRRRGALPARLAARQGRLGRRPPGLPAQGPHRPPRPAPDDPQVRAAWPRSARSPSPSTTSWAPATRRTAIGYAVGLKEAMRHGQGPDGKVVAVVGDGAMTGGVAFEAVHQAGGLGTPLVVILNDNGMSIAPNVGALQPLLQPRPARSRPVEGARGRGGEAHAAAGRHRRAVRAPRPAAQGVRQGAVAARPVVGGARLGLHGRHRRPRRARRPQGDERRLRGRAPRRHPRRHRQGQGLRARRGGRPGGHGEVARRQAELDRARPAGAVQAQEERRARRSTRRCSARRWCASASATSAWSASRPP